MSYAVIDLETSIYESFNRKANAFDSRNYIVANGLKYQDGRKLVLHKLRDESLFPTGWLNGVTCLVGQNIKFDMQYIWSRPEVQEWLKNGGRIYDTMYAEYLLTGQHQRFENGQAEGLDLNSLALKYGGTTKPDIIKEYWQNGIQTIDIDQDELLEYLDGDIVNTEIVFLGQIKKYVPMGMTNTIKAHMEGLLSTIEMEVNGLAIDQEVGEVHRVELVKEIADIVAELDVNIPADLPPELVWNWNSGTHLSALFFGGRLKFARRVQKTNEDGSFQFTKAKESRYVCQDESTITEAEFALLSDTSNLKVYSGGKKVGQFVKRNVEIEGEAKFHTVDMWHTVHGTVSPRAEWQTKKEGVYQTDSKVKTILAAEGHPLAKLIHRLGKMTKLLAFYRYTDKDGKEKGLLTMIQEDGFIHHRLNTTTTVTGRLSSSDPNMQQCFDAETEILTEDGFIPFPVYCGGMEDIPRCAQFNMRSGNVTWIYPKKLIGYPYTGNMVRYVSEHTDMFLTEDHRCVVSVKSGGWGFLKARYLNHPRGWQYSHNYVNEDGQGRVIGETVDKYELCETIEVEDMMVYCVQVPERAIVVRRNGKVYISGNCPRSDTGKVREMFVSRFGEDGLVGEIDFSQLEVHGQAFLSGDENMIRDVTNRVDFHCMRVAAKMKEDYEYVKVRCKDESHEDHRLYKSLRTGAKSFSFQRAYGASVATIAADTGMDINDVQALADSEDILYPAVGEYNNENISKVNYSANNSGEWITTFDPERGISVKYGIGYLTSPTGKRYSFVQQDAPAWMQERQKKRDAMNAKRGFAVKKSSAKTIAPQQVKNYPVQGFCGELMMNVCGALFREFLANNRWENKAFLVNTVHDCVWVDCHKSVAKEVILKVKEIMEQAAQIMEQRYKIKIDVPFYAEAEMGLNFYRMEGLH